MSFDRRLGYRTREVWAVAGTETKVDDYLTTTTSYEIYAVAPNQRLARDYLHDVVPYAPRDAEVVIVEANLIEG